MKSERKKSQQNAKHIVEELLSIMQTLRSKDGCPWDKEQTHQSLKKYLIEEAAEFLDAVDDEDDEGMKEELGDILLHVIFHSQIASERKAFNFEDVVHGICEKLKRRHPHVFGNSRPASSASEVIQIWDEVKKKEKQNSPSSAVENSRHFPALLKAEKIQKKAAKLGFDWSDKDGIIRKIEEELSELKKALKQNNKKNIEDEIGDLLFSVVNLARFLNLRSTEEILASTSKKFQKRFQFIEREFKKSGKTFADSNISEMERLWQKAKKDSVKCKRT